MVSEAMVDRLPVLQKFLGFISKNHQVLTTLLLLISIGANVYLVKTLIDTKDGVIQERQNSVDYERERAKSYEDIIKEQIRQSTLLRDEKDTLY